MPWLRSFFSTTLAGSKGTVKRGQPQPLSNFFVEAKRGSLGDDIDVNTRLLFVPELIVEGRFGGTFLGHRELGSQL
jgi:hypothetical protein